MSDDFGDDQVAIGFGTPSYGRGLDAPHVSDSVYAHFKPAPLPYHEAADGMPAPVVSQRLALRVPLTYGTLVCMADRRAFVIRDGQREELCRFTPEEVSQTPDGRYWAPTTLALWRLEEKVARAPGVFLRRLGYALVEPVRPACQHYGRQFVDLEADAQLQERLCMKRASDDGIPLSLSDSAMYACDFRNPPDVETSRRMDGFDQKVIEAGLRRVAESEGTDQAFDVEAALDLDAERARVGRPAVMPVVQQSAPLDSVPLGIFDRRDP